MGFAPDSLVAPWTLIIIVLWLVGGLVYYKWVSHLFTKDYGDCDDVKESTDNSNFTNSVPLHTRTYYAFLAKRRVERHERNVSIARGEYIGMRDKKNRR